MFIDKEKSWFKHIDFLIIDIVAISFSFVLANLFYFHSLKYYQSNVYITILTTIYFAFFIVNSLSNQYSGILRRNNTDEIKHFLLYFITTFFINVFIIYIFRLSLLFSRATLLITYFIYLIIGFLIRIIWKSLIISRKVSFAHQTQNNLLIVAKQDNIKDILNNVNKEKYNRFNIVGLCIIDGLDKDDVYGYKNICGYDELFDNVISLNINEVYFAIDPSEIDKKLIEKLINEGIGIQLDIKSIFDLETDNQVIDKVGIYSTLGLGLYVFKPNQLFYMVIKRTLDILISLLALIPLCILTIIIKCVYVLSGDNSSIFFTQQRVGLNGKVFKIYKFRTMVPNAEEELNKLLENQKLYSEWKEKHKLNNDPRITNIGRILRKSSLDEFPQFINVLKDDMAIVGPRPLAIGELKMHNGLKLYERIKPGITGWWACNGRSNITYEERLDLEYYYVKNCSLYLDILTILRTFTCVVKKTGAK